MSASIRVACPMCGQPLDRGAVEVVNIEFSTLNACGRCGFGLDLRWRGRGSALARPTPDWVIASPLESTLDQLRSHVPAQLKIEQVKEPVEALGVYARALRRQSPLSLLVIMSRGSGERYSDTAVAIRALEEGFQVERPIPICYISAQQLDVEEQQLFHELRGIHWRPCAPNQELLTLLEMAPQLLQAT